MTNGKTEMETGFIHYLPGRACRVALFQRPVSYQRVKITDKFYTPNRKEVPVATGVKTKRKIKVAPTTTKPYCAIAFNNGKTLTADCDTYLNFNIGDQVYIKYRGNRLTDIRRKG